jgi:hypothetical protein
VDERPVSGDNRSAAAAAAADNDGDDTYDDG